jgi:hypothetical protein
MEMRGHENVVEAVVFAPVVAYAAIQELASIEVGCLITRIPYVIFQWYGPGYRSKQGSRAIHRYMLPRQDHQDLELFHRAVSENAGAWRPTLMSFHLLPCHCLGWTR